MDTEDLQKIAVNVSNNHNRIVNRILVEDHLRGAHPTYDRLDRYEQEDKYPVCYINENNEIIKSNATNESGVRSNFITVPIIEIDQFFSTKIGINAVTTQINQYIDSIQEKILISLLDKSSSFINKVIHCKCKKLAGKTTALKNLQLEINKWDSLFNKFLCNYKTYLYLCSNNILPNYTQINFSHMFFISSHVPDNVIYGIAEADFLGVMPIAASMTFMVGDNDTILFNTRFGMCIMNGRSVSKLVFDEKSL